MAQVYDEPIVVRLIVPVGSYPVGTEFGFKDVADAIRALGSASYFEVVRTQDGDPIPPPTPEDLTEAEKQALARARAARLIRGKDFDPLWERLDGIPSAEDLDDMRATVDAVAGIEVYADAEGAKGDGATIDTDALRQAITKAGENGILRFTPGKTYVIDGSLRPLPNQTWLGYGATLKRCDVRSATVPGAIASADSTVTVSDASPFRVGTTVSFFHGTTYVTHNFDITKITGNTLTLSASIGTALPAGATIYTSFEMIKGGTVNVEDFKLYGLTFDGNRGNNALLARWQNHAEVNLWADRMVIRDCYSFDAQCEVFEFNGEDITIADNVIINAGGNGVHMGATRGTRIIGNSIVGANLAGTEAGHQDGCISASNNVYDTMIIGNYFENGISGIGSWDSTDNTGLTATGNTIRNCRDYALELRCPSGQWTEDIVITGNRIYDSVVVSITTTKSAPLDDEGPRRMMINDNYLADTTILIQRGFGIMVANNSFFFTTPPAAAAIYVTGTGGRNISITGNQIRGAMYGIAVDGSTPALIANNTVINATRRGIHGSGFCTIRGNWVTANDTVDTSFVGVLAVAGDVVDSNTITASKGGYGIQCPSGSEGATSAIVTNNTIRTPTGMPSIRLISGSQNNIVRGNFILQPMSNLGGEANIVLDNTTLLS